MAYDAGEAFLRIIPSFDGVLNAITAEAAKWGVAGGKAYSDSFNDTVRRQTNNAPIGPTPEQSTKQGTQSAGKFADGFKARLAAALRALPPIELGVAATEAEQKLRDIQVKLLELSKQRIGIDIDEAEAIARIAELKAQLDELGASSESVSVKMNTAAASAELDKLRAEIDRLSEDSPDVDVKADTASADAKLAATKAAADELGRSSPSISPNVDAGPALAAIGVIKTALLGLSAGAVITPLVGGLAALLGPIAAVGAGLGGIAAVGIPAISAVTKAEKAQGAASTGSGQSAAAAALQKISAANSVKSAEEALAGAQKTAANDAVSSAQKIATAEQGVKTAEQAVTTAQKAAADAQVALTNAREAATRSLQDSAFSVQDATLALQADQLAVIDAQQNLAAVNANATSTDLQKQEAALQLAQAQQALAEQTVTLQRATDDNTAAQKAGVDGSKQVVAAQTAVSTANKQIVTSQQGVVTATAAVAAAKKAAADQAAQDAQKIGDAQRALAQAQLSQAASAEAAAGGTNAYGKALAALTPAELALKSALDGFKGQFKDFQTALDPVVIPVFTGALKILGDILKPLEPLITVVAKAITAVETSVDKAIQGPGFKKFLDTLTSLAGPTVQSLATIFGNLAGVFGNVVEAFAPLASTVFGGLATLTGGLEKATTSPALANFVKVLVDLGPTLITAFHDIGGLIGSLFTTLAPLAKPVFALIGSLATALSGIVKDVGPSLTQLFNILGPAISQVVAALSPSLVSIVESIATVVGKLLPVLLPVLPVLANVVAAIASFLAGLSPDQLLLIVAALGALVAYLGGPITAAFVAAAALGALIVEHWSQIKPAIQPVLDVFTDVWGFITQKLVPVLKGIFLDALNGLKTAFKTIGDAIEGHKSQLLQLQHAFNDLNEFIVRFILPIFGPILKGAFELIGLTIKVFVLQVVSLVDAFNWLVGIAKTVGEWFAGPFVDFFVAAGRDIGGAWNATMGAIVTAWHAVANFFTTAWADFIGAVTTAWNAITGAISGAWRAVVGGVQTAWTDTANFLKGAWDTFAGDVARGWHAITSPITAAWNGTFGALKSAYTEVRDFLVNDWNEFASTAGKLWDNIAGGIGKAFGAVTGAVKGVWHDVESVFVGAVNWVINNVIDKFIGLLNGVLGVFSVHIDPVKPIATGVQSANATGGVLPGYTPGTDGVSLPVHLFSGGEGILVPEATRALGGAAGINAINSHFSNRVSQKFSKGGTTDVGNSLPRTAYEQILLDAQAARDAGAPVGGSGPGGSFPGEGGAGGAIGGAIGGITSGAASVIAAIRTGVASAAIAALTAAEAPVKAIIGAAPGNLTKNLANGVFNKINDAAFSFIKGNVTPSAPTTDKAVSVSAEHQLFIETALYAAGLSTDPFNVTDVNTIVDHESGWNPTAINLTDSNAKAGHPSQGLMQTIPSTFEAHRLASLPDVITDALANLVAGIRYAVGRYGSVSNVPGVRAVRDGNPYVGYDNGGMLPPGISSVYNGTGKPEPVFTNAQWGQLQNLGSNDKLLQEIATNTRELIGVRQIGAAAEYAAGTANGAIGILEGVGR